MIQTGCFQNTNLECYHYTSLSSLPWIPGVSHYIFRFMMAAVTVVYEDAIPNNARRKRIRM
jgi:hypothetical protein